MAKTIRKAIAILLTATAVILLLLPAADVSATYSKGDYVIDGGTLVSYTGSDSDITIPLGITSIGKDAFSGNNNLSRVYIPDEVTNIDYAAFENCKNLNKVELGDGIKYIGASAFSGCQNLTDINIPKYVENIGSAAFAACPNLSDIAVDEKNRNFVCLDGVLYSKDGKKLHQYLAGRPYSTYLIPEPVKEIDEFCFYGANMLTDVNVVYGIEEIPEYAFLNCTALNHVDLPASLKAIRKGAFGGCSNLTKLTVPTSVGYIDDEAFTSMDGKKGDVVNDTTGEVLSESGESLATANNADTDNLDDAIADGENYVESEEGDGNLIGSTIDSSSFNSMIPGKTEGEMSSTVIVGGNAVFLLNPKDMKVRGFDMNAAQTEDSIADSWNSSTMSDDFRATSGNTFDIIDGIFGHYGGSDSEITLPENVTKVGNRVFYKNNSINSVVLPSNLKEIGDFAFARSSVNGIDIPYGTEKIGYAAFYNCANLTNVSVPGSVKEIELGAFDGTGFINNWKRIEDGNNFLVLGDGILLAYKGHGSEVRIPNSVKQIGPGVFEGNTRIKSVILPDSLVKIGEDAFNGCTKINNIQLPRNVEIIEDRAFKDTNLKNVRIPMAVKQIGLGAFDTSLVNGGLDTVTFDGVSLPSISYKPTVTRLSASDLRTEVFNGTKYAFVPVNANVSSSGVLSPELYGFKGEVFSIDNSEGSTGSYVQLRKCMKEPDNDGIVYVDSSIEIDGNTYLLNGVSESAFDYYKEPSWSNSTINGIVLNGENSNALNALISDINFAVQAGNTSNSDMNNILVSSPDNSIDSSKMKVTLPDNSEKFYLNVKKDDSLRQSFNTAFANRYGSYYGVNMHTMSIDMTDKTKSIPIKKMSTSKLNISMPVPDEFMEAENVRVATLDDNGLLEEISCDITEVNENTKEISFVASHLSPFAVFTKQTGDIDGEIQTNVDNKITGEISATQAFAANTVNMVAGEAVYGTLQKEVAPGVPVRYFVVILLIATAGLLFVYNGRKRKE